MVCLEAEEQRLNNNGAETSHLVVMYFDRRCAILLNVCFLLALKTPGQPELRGPTGATWEEHSRPTNAKKLYLDVSLGQTRVPFVGHVSCVRLRRSAARLFDRVRMIHVGRRSYGSSPRPRAGPHHWVPWLAIQICQGQSAQAGSCSSSGHSAAGVGKGDNRKHKAQTGTQDPQAKALQQQVAQSWLSLQLRVPNIVIRRGPGNLDEQKEATRKARATKVKRTEFPHLCEVGVTLCPSSGQGFKDESCRDSGCQRLHVCAACGNSAPFVRRRCLSN